MQCQLQIINGSVASLNYLIAHLAGSLVFDVAYRRPSSPKKNFNKLFFLFCKFGQTKLAKIFN